MIKAIVFDLGGVIQGLDWSPVVNSILDLKEDLNIEEYKAAFYHDRKEYFDLYSTNKIGKNEFWGMVASRLDIDSHHADRLSDSFELIYSFVNYDMLDLLKELKHNYRLFVLSNACPEIERKVVKDNIYVYSFESMYFSHNIELKKPDPKAFYAVTRENGIKPEECIFVDNDMINIKGAISVGMEAILYKGLDSLKADLYKKLKVKVWEQ